MSLPTSCGKDKVILLSTLYRRPLAPLRKISLVLYPFPGDIIQAGVISKRQRFSVSGLNDALQKGHSIWFGSSLACGWKNPQ